MDEPGRARACPASLLHRGASSPTSSDGPQHRSSTSHLFRSATYTGATISNFLLNGAAGTLMCPSSSCSSPDSLSAQQAGMLTLGYAIAIVSFIRVGEKLLQRFGARKPIIWGCAVTGLSIILLMPTNTLLAQYKGSWPLLATRCSARSRVVRHAVNRRGAFESDRRAGRFRLRDL